MGFLCEVYKQEHFIVRIFSYKEDLMENINVFFHPHTPLLKFDPIAIKSLDEFIECSYLGLIYSNICVDK